MQALIGLQLILLNVPNGDLMLEMDNNQPPKLVECPSWNMQRGETYKAT
jgi:hypothetical protein